MAVNVGEVSVEMLLDFERSEREAKDFEAKIANAMASVSNLGPEAYREFSKKAAAHLKKVEAETKKTADALAKAEEKGGFGNKLKNGLKELPGLLGDVGDVVNMLGADFLGLSEEQAKAADGMFSLAEKGGQIGMLFGGPVGAGIGAAGGALLGWIKASKEAERLEFQRSFERTLGTAERLTENLKEQIKQEKQRAEAAKLIHEWKTGELAVTDDILERTRRLIDAEKRRAEIRAEAARLTMTPAEIRAELKEAQAAYDALLDDARRGGGALIEAELLKAKERLDAAKSAVSALGTTAKSTGKAAKDTQKEFNDMWTAARKWQEQIDADAEAASQFVEAFEPLAALTIPELPLPDLDRAISEFEDFAQRYQNAIAPIGTFTSAVFDQVADNIAQNQAAFEGMGNTARAALSGILRTLAKEWGAKSLAELAAGFAALGNPLLSATAPFHFKSSALYGAAAVGAGGFGIAAGAGTQAGSLGGGSAGRGSASGGSSPSLGRSANQGTVTQGTTIVYLGAPGATTIFAGDSERGKAQAFEVIEGWKRSHARQGGGRI
jgi:gas vesicle protein